jgi:hypothetical protein
VKRNHDIESLMLAVAYGEASEAEEIELHHVLENDSTRRDEFSELQKTVTTLEANLVVNDPGEDYWEGTWDRFQDKLAASQQKVSKKETNTDNAWFMFWRPALQISFVAAMLVMAVFVGKVVIFPTMPNQNLEASGDTVLEGQLLDKVVREKNDYLQTVAEDSLLRSNRVLDQFMDIDPKNMVVDSTAQREWVTSYQNEIENLMEIISTLRDFENSDSLRQITPLLDELELTIGEIASLSMRDGYDASYEIQMLQDGIQRRNLINRLRQLTTNRSTLRTR